MAVMTIRNVPDEVHERLRLRAARAGTSMEAEVRSILLQASLQRPKRVSSQNLQAWVGKLYATKQPLGVVDDLLAERKREARRETGSKRARK